MSHGGKFVDKGVDRRGGSRVSATMDYDMVQDGEGRGIAIKSVVTLSGLWRRSSTAASSKTWWNGRLRIS